MLLGSLNRRIRKARLSSKRIVATVHQVSHNQIQGWPSASVVDQGVLSTRQAPWSARPAPEVLARQIATPSAATGAHRANSRQRTIIWALHVAKTARTVGLET